MTADEPDDEAESEAGLDERVTSPMQGFGSREVTIGILVLLVGLVIAFLLPFVL